EQHDHGPQLAGKLTHVEARQCQQVLVSEALNGAQMIGTRARRQLQQRPDIGAIAGEGESQRALEAIAILGVSGLLGRREGNERAAQLDLFAGELAAQRGGDLVDGALAMAPQPLTAGLAPDLCRRAFEIGDELIGRAAAPPRACLELAEERAAILLREEGMVAAVDVVDPGELFGKPCLYGHTDAPAGGVRTGPGNGRRPYGWSGQRSLERRELAGPGFLRHLVVVDGRVRRTPAVHGSRVDLDLRLRVT